MVLNMQRTDWFTWLGNRRDGFLIVGAVLYGLGYAVWSYNAWKHDLGHLPAIEFQYFAAGIIPALVLTTAWLVSTSFLQAIDQLIDKAITSRYRAWALIFSLGLLTFAMLFSTIFLEKKNIINMASNDYFFLLNFTILVSVLVLILSTYVHYNITFESKPESSGNRIADIIVVAKNAFAIFSFRLLRILVLIITFTIFLKFYLEYYSRLPQELGGPKPRCAYIDLLKDEITPTSLIDLAPNHQAGILKSEQTRVIRSSKLNVYFAGTGYLLVRNIGDPSSQEDAPLYELRSDIIRVVQWCSD